jgi:hypothetical protein
MPALKAYWYEGLKKGQRKAPLEACMPQKVIPGISSVAP